MMPKKGNSRSKRQPPWDRGGTSGSRPRPNPSGYRKAGMQMNITHLKYAVEIARTGSITQAAENLYMSQPNLSKAIKEFESTLGFVVFKRTSKGIEPTQKGRELIERARELLAQIDEMDAAFLAAAQSTQALSVSVPRASYIAHAFTRFVDHLDMAGGMDIDFCETNSVAAITNVAEGESALGVIRCPKETEKYFFSLLSEKGLAHELLLEYKYRLLFSEKSPLADRPSIRRADLEDYIEIVHGDLTVPFLPMTKQKSRLVRVCRPQENPRLRARQPVRPAAQMPQHRHVGLSDAPRAARLLRTSSRPTAPTTRSCTATISSTPPAPDTKKFSAFLSKIYVLYQKNCFEFRFLCVSDKVISILLYRYNFFIFAFFLLYMVR